MNVTAINVFIEIDGKQYIAPVTAESAELFIGMLPAFQSGKQSSTQLVPLHDDIAKHLLAMRRALLDRFQHLEAEKRKAKNKSTNLEGAL